MPVFFEQATFIVQIASDRCLRETLDPELHQYNTAHSELCGIFYLSDRVAGILRAHSAAAIFRNVTFDIYWDCHIVWAWLHFYGDAFPGGYDFDIERSKEGEVELHYTCGALSPTCTTNPLCWKSCPNGHHGIDDTQESGSGLDGQQTSLEALVITCKRALELTMADVVNVAQQGAGKSDFKGFTIDNLKEVALAFRCGTAIEPGPPDQDEDYCGDHDAMLSLSNCIGQNGYVTDKTMKKLSKANQRFRENHPHDYWGTWSAGSDKDIKENADD